MRFLDKPVISVCSRVAPIFVGKRFFLAALLVALFRLDFGGFGLLPFASPAALLCGPKFLNFGQVDRLVISVCSRVAPILVGKRFFLAVVLVALLLLDFGGFGHIPFASPTALLCGPKLLNFGQIDKYDVGSLAAFTDARCGGGSFLENSQTMHRTTTFDAEREER
eukprot:CAMPEP_0183388398 /NCGR_PEP_ID=MMETSP0370-20130417/4028_1 /TAXON_ID=268820 /ORGANISM="Peridinium aciculiferum, Strain PAER-2" /LENGTH=165 /DNA_ID=CAMNT_0025567319 /DNA_START=74 /DNA_END=571 /DNA_ORIENTATION=-